MSEPSHPVGDARVLAALNVLGWPDDREMSAHVEPDGYHVTPAGLYWEIVSEALAAADLPARRRVGPVDVQRTAGLLRAAATMYGDEDVLAAADLLEWQSLEIARLRRMFDSARHVGVETAATEAVARPVESAAELRTTTGEGDPSGPEQELLEVDTLIWDWKEQPDLDDLAAILARHGVRLTQIDTGGDDYEIRISSADECPNLAQVLATDTGSHDDSVCGWCADLRAKREAARGRLRTLVFNAITRTLAGRTFVPLGAREDVARAVVDALDCAADNRSAQ